MPQYEVVRLGGRIPVHAPEFGVLDGPCLPPELDPKMYAVRPVKDPNWRERERERFRTGVYKLPPWPEHVLERLAEDWPDHFLHVSTKDPTKVSYTETVEKGEIDRQCAPMSPGRYLQQFAVYKDYKGEPTSNRWMSEEDIRTFTSMLIPPDALRFAKTADEMEMVYEEGPSSCMAHSSDQFHSSMHPVRVYAAGDLEVAYLTVNGSTIVARGLVWPEKKVHGRLYGDEHRLAEALRTAGYSLGSLVGARLLRITEGDGFICPYIDRHNAVEDDGEYLRIAECGIPANSTTGLIGIGEYCDRCGDTDDPDNMTWVSGELWCTSCYEDHAFYCEGYREVYHVDEMGGEVDGVGLVCQTYLDNECFHCDRLDRYFRTADMDAITMANGEVWSWRAVERYGNRCERTDEYYPDDELTTLADTGEAVSIEWAQEHAFEKDGEFYDKDPDELEEAA